MSLLLLGQQNTLAQQVAALFPDVWYDPSDLTTLYQDAAGTTPVTAVEQSVGLMLDKSKGLVLGSELVTNGDFSSSTGWSTEAGITIGGGVASFATTSNQVLYQTINATPGRFFQVTLTVVSYTSGTPQVSINGGAVTVNIPNPSVLGAKTLYVISGSSDALLRIRSGTFGVGGTCVIDNISVRELPGNHAFHTPGDTTTRPTYSRRINLLTKTEDFSDTGAWTTQRANVSANSTTAPNGTLTADTLTETSETGTHQIYRIVNFGVATYTRSIYAKANGRTQFHFEQESGGNARFTLVGDGTALALGSNTVSITNVGNGWYLCTSTFTVTGGFGLYTVLYNGSSISYTGDGTSGIYIWGASTAPADLAALPYQRVNTATDYDADASKFPSYLRCDGTNDGMQTNSIDFSGTDKMFVSGAVRKLSDAINASFIELSTTGGNPGAFHVVTSPSASAGYSFRSTGSSTVTIDVTTGYAAPISNVLSGVSNIAAPSAALRLNGTQVAQSTASQGTGNYGNYPLYLFRRGGTTLPFNGWFYGSVIKGTTLTAAQISLVERYLASKTKTVVLA